MGSVKDRKYLYHKHNTEYEAVTGSKLLTQVLPCTVSSYFIPQK